MEGQSSLSKQAKFSWRILFSSGRILRSPLPNEHPECYIENQLCGSSEIS